MRAIQSVFDPLCETVSSSWSVSGSVAAESTGFAQQRALFERVGEASQREGRRGSERPLRDVQCSHERILPALLIRWGAYCERLFEDLVRDSPGELAELVRGTALSNPRLTFAAEILGRAESTRLIETSLLPLLRHSAAVVREGAVYGLARHADHRGVLAALRRVAMDDTSEGVRRAAQEAVEGADG